MLPSLALLMLQTATVDPAADPALAKPITIHLALRPVKEIVKAMAAASGGSLAAAGPVADLKATVLVKGLPAGRAMEALADTLGLAWRKEDDGYRLFRTPEATKALDAYVALERSTKGDNENTKAALANAAAIAAQPNDNDAIGGAGTTFVRQGRPRRGDRARGGATPVSYVRFDPSLLAVESARTEPPTRLEPASANLGNGAFATANAAWPTVEKGLDPAWSKGMRIVTMKPSTWENGGYTLSDLLVAWHDATDLPVVADAFRLAMKSSSPPQTWALASLQGLAQGDRLALHVANGVARLRHPAYWRLREQEASESAWRILEDRKPAIGDYASFALGLTAPQAAAFRSQEAPLSHVTTEALRLAYPALRLWASLPGSAQNALLAGRAVPLSSAGGTDAYLFALREAPYYHAGDPTSTLATNAAQLGLFAASSPKQVALRLGAARGGGVEYPITLP